MIVKKAKPLPVECVVRGYLAGSGWKEYQAIANRLRHPASRRLAAGLGIAGTDLYAVHQERRPATI